MEKRFDASVDTLQAAADFANEFCAQERLDPAAEFAVGLAIEEIFTNLVKYGRATSISIRLQRVDAEIRITLTGFDVDPFDPTLAPSPVVDLPLAERRPGGLGLHLVRSLMDRMEYAHSDRTSTITLAKRMG